MFEKYLYKAKRVDNGEDIIGSLIYSPDSPFVYIATMENMIVDELNEGNVSNLRLIRVMEKSIRSIGEI